MMTTVVQNKGDALVFHNLHTDATKDPTSYHASCPTTAGEKYSLTKWIRVHPAWQYHGG
jgi:hypothetical protein